MFGYSEYKSLGGFSGRREKAIKSLLLGDEEFLRAIDCAEGRTMTKWNTKLVLTNQRILAVRKALIGKESEDYSLSDISSIKYDTGMLTGELTLQGSGIDDSYDLPKNMGERFVNAAREQSPK